MGTNHVSIKIFNSPKDAPHYTLPEYKGASVDEAVIVRKGTEGGNDTVDLIFTDESGQKYVTMITGNILKSIAAATNIHN